MNTEQKRNYIIWQNRAFRFYLASRVLARNELHAPAAYSAVLTIELMLKATLVCWEKGFEPEAAGHAMAKLQRMVRNKTPGARQLDIPNYFYEGKRFLDVTRYPANGKGVLVPRTLLEDLDSVFAQLVGLVPYQFNSELIRALSGKNRKALGILRYKNASIRALRSCVAA